MTFGTILVFATALALSFVNGANDNPKGVATLVGADRLSRRAAIHYATATTFLGSVTALFLARGLLARFGGKGLLASELTKTPLFALAVGGAAGATVILATRLGLPVSTTHALVGGLAGVGLASGSLRGGALAAAFVAPLLLSPLMALAATAAMYPVFRRCRLALGVSHESCICLTTADPAPMSGAAIAAARSGVLHVVRDDLDHCAGYTGSVAGIGAQRVLDGCHLLTAGAVSFARGVNDTPKIAALLLVAAPFGVAGTPSILSVGVAMALGGLLASRRVATTMSHRITEMNDGQAFTANLATAGLVLAASRFGLPVSTTHVSVGALVGIGALTGAARWKTIGTILASWVAILPLSAALAAVLWFASISA